MIEKVRNNEVNTKRDFHWFEIKLTKLEYVGPNINFY